MEPCRVRCVRSGNSEPFCICWQGLFQVEMTGSPGGSVEVDNPPNGPLRSGRDQPSAESRLRDALTFLTSSSLRPTGLPTGGTERVLSLPAIAGWLRISG